MSSSPGSLSSARYNPASFARSLIPLCNCFLLLPIVYYSDFPAIVKYFPEISVVEPPKAYFSIWIVCVQSVRLPQGASLEPSLLLTAQKWREPVSLTAHWPKLTKGTNLAARDAGRCQFPVARERKMKPELPAICILRSDVQRRVDNKRMGV